MQNDFFFYCFVTIPYSIPFSSSSSSSSSSRIKWRTATYPTTTTTTTTTTKWNRIWNSNEAIKEEIILHRLKELTCVILAKTSCLLFAYMAYEKTLAKSDEKKKNVYKSMDRKVSLKAKRDR